MSSQTVYLTLHLDTGNSIRLYVPQASIQVIPQTEDINSIMGIKPKFVSSSPRVEIEAHINQHALNDLAHYLTLVAWNPGTAPTSDWGVISARVRKTTLLFRRSG